MLERQPKAIAALVIVFRAQAHQCVPCTECMQQQNRLVQYAEGQIVVLEIIIRRWHDLDMGDVLAK